MSTDPVAVIEYETLVFGRHISSMPGRTRRSGGVLDQSAYVLLSVLLAAGPQSISELSTVTGLDASTLNRQTAALLRDEYAERIPDPDGGLARKFRVTPAGQEVLTEEREGTCAALSRLMADWSSTDREKFAELLGRLNRTIEDRTGRPWPRPQ